MRKNLFFMILGFTLFSCTQSKTLILTTHNAEGITNETKLKVSGIEIGEVETLQLDSYGHVLIHATLNSEIQLPVDSKFTAENQGLLSDKVITVTLGTKSEMLDGKSTVVLETEKETFFSDSLSVHLKNALQQISGKEKNDSILKELRRLNDNLEKRKQH
ncbi:MlaD family protein [Flavobacterium sp. GCM10027622]|uniref:MlaD family protein n=1 Tax=unclassified Flavobacterium TaxID=196869 RepID=UPI00360CBB7A